MSGVEERACLARALDRCLMFNTTLSKVWLLLREPESLLSKETLLEINLVISLLNHCEVIMSECVLWVR